ncbi:MAG: zinc-ribbon domain-containing protein, partial [Gemmatimonadales bacterium]|nr:zinc-ribbon domain-containing protein [Gemmatimonadales bacterium]
MNVTCPNCATTYRVDPAKVPEAGVRARCAVCSAVFAVRRDMADSPPEAQGVETPAPRPRQPETATAGQPDRSRLLEDAPRAAAPEVRAPDDAI